MWDSLGPLQAWSKGCILSHPQLTWHEWLTQQLDSYCSLTPLSQVHTPKRTLQSTNY